MNREQANSLKPVADFFKQYELPTNTNKPMGISGSDVQQLNNLSQTQAKRKKLIPTDDFRKLRDSINDWRTQSE